MAFKARLNFSGKEYNGLYCFYSLNCNLDAKGRSSPEIYGGAIDINKFSQH